MDKKSAAFIHLAFWALFVLLGVLMNVALHHDFHVSWQLYEKDFLDPFTAVGYGRTILTCYISLWTFNYFFSRSRYLFGAASLLFLIIFDVGLRYLIEQVLIGPVFGLWQYPAGIHLNEYLAQNLFFSALGIFICFFLKIVNDYFVTEKIRQEKDRMELQFLKSQINPHFLFNSFNNLYGLSLTEPDKTPDAILKLAGLTRYMIYESSEDRVALGSELTYLQNLIELQKLRYEEPVCLELDMPHTGQDLQIAPLLLIAFAENAFKHGELHDPEHPVQITLQLSGNHLYFRVANKISPHQKDSAGGIGLANVRRRLHLLYGGNHSLRISSEGGNYESILNLVLHA